MENERFYPYCHLLIRTVPVTYCLKCKWVKMTREDGVVQKPDDVMCDFGNPEVVMKKGGRWKKG